MKMLTWIEIGLQALRNWLTPRRKVHIQTGDTLPAVLPARDLVLLEDNGENWSVGFRCPCGCGDVIELLLLPEVEPRWDIEFNARRQPSLSPSVWKATGCKSHFWLKQGKIIWV